MVAGRVGAAMAAELSTMRVTEQIDARHFEYDPFQVSGLSPRVCCLYPYTSSACP